MSGPPLPSEAAAAVELADVADPAWGRFVARHPEATCFHHPSWSSTLASAYGFAVRVAVQRGTDGTVVAGMPLAEVRRPTGARRWSCLPFSDECAPLVAPGMSAAGLLQGVDALRRAHHVADLEVRTGLDHPGVVSRQVAVAHTLHLGYDTDGGAPPRGPKPSVRRHVARAGRLGVRVDAGRSLADVETYYRLHVRTRRRQGVPAQPRRYFLVLWERMIEPGDGLLLIARQGGRAVAGAVYLVGGRTVTYKYGASDAEFWPLRANHAVMARAIVWAREQGLAAFDFGRTDLDNPGLMQFKASWGARSRPLCYTSFSGRAGRRGTRSVPGLLASVIRHSPSVLCRGLGEVLYRYAA
jgi:CelD/BcsL family acetyltransferase involved in cellulose biosynthesis